MPDQVPGLVFSVSMLSSHGSRTHTVMPLVRRTAAALAAATLLSASAGCGAAKAPGIIAALKGSPIAPRDQQLHTIDRLLAMHRPQRLTTIEYRIGTPVLRVIDRYVEDGTLLADFYVVEGWEVGRTEPRRLYATSDPGHLDAFNQLHRQAQELEFVSSEACMTTNPGMNWVVADSSVGYGLPAKGELLDVLVLASTLVEHGYEVEAKPFSELQLLLFNRGMSGVQWHPTYYHSIAVSMLDAWVRSNSGTSAVPRAEAQGPTGRH